MFKIYMLALWKVGVTGKSAANKEKFPYKIREQSPPRTKDLKKRVKNVIFRKRMIQFKKYYEMLCTV
jgi:hypothetical protein